MSTENFTTEQFKIGEIVVYQNSGVINIDKNTLEVVKYKKSVGKIVSFGTYHINVKDIIDNQSFIVYYLNIRKLTKKDKVKYL